MPLSKKRNKDRMQLIRLHKRLSPLMESKPVQPESKDKPIPQLDDDGNMIPDYENQDN